MIGTPNENSDTVSSDNLGTISRESRNTECYKATTHRIHVGFSGRIYIPNSNA